MTSSCCAAGGQGRQGGDCCATDGNVMLLSCSGGSNVGQLANRACVELTQDGLGKMFCLAGIGGKLSGFMQSAKDVPEMVVLDGCELGCAKAIFREAGIPLRNYLVLTDLGIAKNKDFELKDAELARVKDAARQALAASRQSR